MSKIKNQELEIITQRAKNVGYELLNYSDFYEVLKSDQNYMNEALEVFVFEAGVEYHIIESHIIVRNFQSVNELKTEIQNNIKKTKTYKRSMNWGKKLYDYAKLNNFAFTFVLAIDEP